MLATRDKGVPVSVADMTALGNDWWDAAAKREDAIKNGMRGRGYTWLASVPKLKGLQKVAVERRLDRIAVSGCDFGNGLGGEEGGEGGGGEEEELRKS